LNEEGFQAWKKQQLQTVFIIGDKVTWNSCDLNIPHGSIGTVVGFVSGRPDNRTVVVDFPGQIEYRFWPNELTKQFIGDEEKQQELTISEKEKTKEFLKDKASWVPPDKQKSHECNEGFRIGDKVMPNKEYQDIPATTVGIVVDVSQEGVVRVKFPFLARGTSGMWMDTIGFKPEQLIKQSIGNTEKQKNLECSENKKTQRPTCWIDEDEDEDDENGEDDVQIAGVFGKLAEIEDGLNSRAQEALEKMGRGPAAELLGKVSDKGGAIRNPDRYVTTSANRWIKDEEEYKNQDCPQQGGDARAEQWQTSPYTPENGDDDEDDDYQGENEEVPEQEWHEDKDGMMHKKKRAMKKLNGMMQITTRMMKDGGK